MLESVVQEEVTGCGIASVANIVGKSYKEIQAIANDMGIYAEDELLWSDTRYVREILSRLGFETSHNEIEFESWEKLPDKALLSINHYEKEGSSFWHWVVFKRIEGQSFVLDSASYLPSNTRVDFASMHPKWYIKVKNRKLDNLY